MIKEKLLLVTALAVISAGCTDTARPVAQSNNAAPSTPDRSQTAIAHGPETKPAAPYANKSAGETGKWSASGDPIDTKDLDTAVMSAEKALAGKPSDDKLKKALADAFYKRAVALTDARQYASAIGDYRRTLKHDPSNADAKEWVDKIIMIYGSLNKQAPKEGEEPPPLPFKKA